MKTLLSHTLLKSTGNSAVELLKRYLPPFILKGNYVSVLPNTVCRNPCDCLPYNLFNTRKVTINLMPNKLIDHSLASVTDEPAN